MKAEDSRSEVTSLIRVRQLTTSALALALFLMNTPSSCSAMLLLFFCPGFSPLHFYGEGRARARSVGNRYYCLCSACVERGARLSPARPAPALADDTSRRRAVGTVTAGHITAPEVVAVPCSAVQRHSPAPPHRRTAPPADTRHSGFRQCKHADSEKGKHGGDTTDSAGEIYTIIISKNNTV